MTPHRQVAVQRIQDVLVPRGRCEAAEVAGPLFGDA